MDHDSGTDPNLAEVIDWRAGRTWAVFLGSALAVGLLASGLVWVVESALPRYLAVRLVPWHRAASLLACFLPVILGLAWVSAAGRKDDPQASGRKANALPSYPEIDLPWLAVGLTVFYLAAMTFLGLPLGAVIRDGGLIVFFTAIALVIALRPLALPAALTRWATRKQS